MQATAKKIEKYSPASGDVVVLRNLPYSAKDPGSHKIGSRIGLLVRPVADGRWFARLWQGNTFRQGHKFCRLGRLVDVANIDRLATARERTLGAVVALEAVRP